MRSKHTSKRLRTVRRHRLALALVGAMAMPMAAPALAQNLPESGAVVNGTASIGTAGNQMTITQSTKGAIIDWGSFSIGAGYGVTFNQQFGNNSVTLNRVVSALGPGYSVSASVIDGSLSANGSVFLINPAGITFGNGAAVNVGGLVASTLWMNSGDFINGLSTGQYVFNGFNGDPSVSHQVRNHADLNIGANGLAFVGPTLWNSGAIVTNGGNIGFGAGTAVTLDFVGDGLTQVTINAAPTVDSAIIQDRFGTMTADGRQILLRTAATAAGTGGAIAVSGTLRAQSIANVNGRIELTSVGGAVMVGAPGIFSDAGSPYTVGTLDVSGQAGENGGSVLIQGSGFSMVNDDDTPLTPADPLSVGSMINASGGANGGQVDIQTTGAIFTLPLSLIAADGTLGNGGQVRIQAGGNMLLAGTDITAASKAANGGAIALLSSTGSIATNGTLVASGAGNGGRIDLLAPNGAVNLVGGFATASGGADGGDVQLTGDTIQVGAGVEIRADGGSGSGGTIGLASASSLAAYGLLSARGGSTGGSIGTFSGGTFDIRGLVVDAGSTAGAAGLWTLWAPDIDVVDGADVGPVGGTVLGSNVQDADINNALATGTSVTLRAGTVPSDGGDIFFGNGVDITYAGGGALAFRADANGGIGGTNFGIGATAGSLSMAFNADASNLNNGFAGIGFSNATLASNGADILFYGQSDTAAGFASNYATGVGLANSTISTAGGNVLIRGSSTGTGVTAGVSMQGNTVDSGGGAIDVAGIASGAGAIGVDLTDARLIGTSGDVTVLGNAAAGTGVNFAGQSGISTTTGGIGVTGIGATVGLALTGGELSTDSGHFDLRGRGTGAASDGLVIGQGISIATNGGGIELSGEGGSGAGISLAAGSSVDAGNSLVVIRAGNDGSSDAIRIGGTIASSMAVNLRPGGVDANGGLTERTADAILLGGGTAGFALSGAELALIDTPQLVIGSNLHAGAIQVLGGIARAGNLTLQNDGGSGGIDIQAAVDVGNGTLALSSGGDITQGSSGAITAHSLLARAGGDVLLADANNNVAANTLAGSAGGDFEYQDVDALAIGSVSALGMNAGANGLASIGATGIAAGGNVFVRNLAGDMTLNAGVSGVNIDLVTANTLQNPAGASLLASGDWRVWANTWVGETRGGLAGDGNLPNLYGCAFLGQCGVTVPGIDNHFIYVQQPTALISFDNFTREYGLPNPVFTFTVTGAILGDSGANVASGTGTTTATIGSNVGNYAITGNFSSAAGYRIQFVPGTLAITPATLLFTADPFVRYLGTENPLFTGTVTGFRNGDTVQSVFGDGIVWNSPAGLLSPIGFYPINGGTSAINYVFTQAPGNATALQIIPLPQLSSTPIDLIRETVNTYVYDRNFGGAPMCALNASLEDQQLASTGDELSNEWSKVRSRPNLTNCFETERKNGCGDF